jgi:hypothetical protein
MAFLHRFALLGLPELLQRLFHRLKTAKSTAKPTPRNKPILHKGKEKTYCSGIIGE